MMKSGGGKVSGAGKSATKKVTTGKSVNAYEKKRAVKGMKGYGNASAEVGGPSPSKTSVRVAKQTTPLYGANAAKARLKKTGRV